jgi:hypothetical protein
MSWDPSDLDEACFAGSSSGDDGGSSDNRACLVAIPNRSMSSQEIEQAPEKIRSSDADDREYRRDRQVLTQAHDQAEHREDEQLRDDRDQVTDRDVDQGLDEGSQARLHQSR